MKKSLVFLIIALMVHQHGNSQRFDTTWANRFQQVLDSVCIADNINGASAAVFFPGEGIWTGASGSSSPGVPLITDMRVGIGSLTKLLTAAVMVKLHEDGILSLDDRLSRWLPPYPNIDPNITIRQLLWQQSGIYDITANINFLKALDSDVSHFWTPEETMGYVGPPVFEPGTAWAYSNTNYILAGMIIESATGKSWVRNVHEIIFDPLDMESTFAGAFEPPNGPVAGYQDWYGTGPWQVDPVTSVFSSLSAAGSIFSTAKEMAELYHALFTGKILSDASLQQILDVETSSRYGAGIWKSGDASLHYPWYTHFGWVMSFISQAIYDIKTHSVFCVFTNGGEMPFADLNLNNFTDPMMRVLYNEYPKKQHDAGITRIIDPKEHLGAATVVPRLVLKNFGSLPLTSVQIGCQIDSGPPSDFLWAGNLISGDSIYVTVDAIPVANGFHSLTCYTYEPNHVTDGHLYNDTITASFMAHSSPAVTLPFEEDFEGEPFPPEGWINTPDLSLNWGRTNLTSFTGKACAVVCNYWDDHHGAVYNLDLPDIDLTGISSPTLQFMYASSCSIKLGRLEQDGLKILISADCGSTWQILFTRHGVDLQTAATHEEPFYPQKDEWKEETVSLAGYHGGVIIRFQDICGFGNNLFIDQVRIKESKDIE